jgi:hypothetical protein
MLPICSALPLARTAKALFAEITAARRVRHVNSQHTRNLARRAAALANRSAWIFACCLEFPVRDRRLIAAHYPATVKPVKLNRQNQSARQQRANAKRHFAVRRRIVKQQFRQVFFARRIALVFF